MRKKVIVILRAIGLLYFLKFIRSLFIRVRSRTLRIIFPSGKYIICNKGTIYVNFDDPNYIWYYGKNSFLFQEHLAFTSLFEIRKPNVILDIGAHWGIFPAQLASETNDFAIKRVICIEPDPRNLPALEKTIKLITAFHVDIVPVAISDKSGIIDLYSGSGACAQTYRSDNAIKIGEVRSAPLHEILHDLHVKGEDVTHIKLDIDGFEPAFFCGSLDFLQCYKPLLLIEFWAEGMKAAGFNLADYWAMLHSMYTISEIVYPDNIYLPITPDHLNYLEGKTSHGIVNLLLVPTEYNVQ